MEVSLRQVTKENYEEVCELDVTKEQEVSKKQIVSSIHGFSTSSTPIQRNP